LAVLMAGHWDNKTAKRKELQMVGRLEKMMVDKMAWKRAEKTVDRSAALKVGSRAAH
jgi:hypothetical protein